MHAQPYARQRGGQLAFEAAEVAGVDQVGTQLAQGAHHAQEVAGIGALAPVQVDHLDAVLAQVRMEDAVLAQAQHGMAVAFGRRMLDQVEQGGTGARGVEPVHDVGDQPRLVERAGQAGGWAVTHGACPVERRVRQEGSRVSWLRSERRWREPRPAGANEQHCRVSGGSFKKQAWQSQ
ncbi:hypothetical protein [Massilia sp. SYSU DXS3249]